MNDAEIEKRKKYIFDRMAPRRQKHILKKGYDQWEPFQDPKDPIDIRKDKTNRTAQDLTREFLQSKPTGSLSASYKQAVLDICIGMVNNDDRYLAMYEFSYWYRKLLKTHG